MTKYILFGLGVACLVFSAFRFFTKAGKKEDQAVNAKITTIRLSKKLVDVGERKQNSDVEAKYVMYNTGANDLYIENVLPDCHCTVANFPHKPVPPNDSIIITLRYDAVQPGVFQSSAVVTTNANEPNALIIFRGSIVQ